MEGRTILPAIAPILIPTAETLGIDMVHFGVVVALNIMIGLITPPYGLLPFIVSNIAHAAEGHGQGDAALHLQHDRGARADHLFPPVRALGSPPRQLQGIGTP
jgi:hypothetical protein